MTEQPGWTPIASIGDFGVLRQLCRTVGGIEVLLLRFGTEIYALQNRCSHLGQPLLGGRTMGRQIICPFHGACYDIKSGAAISGPAVSPIQTFPVEIREGIIFVDTHRHTG
jgi:3-phenylpropionate/trans-cinnamate dioxygenase ferredoxin component